MKKFFTKKNYFLFLVRYFGTDISRSSCNKHKKHFCRYFNSRHICYTFNSRLNWLDMLIFFNKNIKIYSLKSVAARREARKREMLIFSFFFHMELLNWLWKRGNGKKKKKKVKTKLFILLAIVNSLSFQYGYNVDAHTCIHKKIYSIWISFSFRVFKCC